MKNKKAFAIHWLVLIFAFFIMLGTFFYYYTMNEIPIRGSYIGDFQLSLIKNFQKAENILLYLDQSAKYALQQTVYDLADKGGYNEPSCSYFQGASIWASIEKDKNELKIKKCQPSDQDVLDNLLDLFNEKLNYYLANYPDAYIPGVYDYEVRGNLEVIGEATENLAIDIVPEDFAAKPIQVAVGEIPPLLNKPMKGNPDIETIKLYHPEVWEKYTALCKKMGANDILGNPPGQCKFTLKQCCITSGYRHPAYNKEEKGARNSPHQYGVALDIYIGRGQEEQLKWVRVIEANKLFTRVGIYPTSIHIHVDAMPLQEPFATPFWIGHQGKTLERAYTLAELENKATKYG